MLQILTSAKKSWLASVQNANAKILLEVMSANAVAVCYTHEKMTHALVSLFQIFFLSFHIASKTNVEKYTSTINAGKYTSSVVNIWMIILVLVVTLSGGYAFYKYRIQV